MDPLFESDYREVLACIVSVRRVVYEPARPITSLHGQLSRIFALLDSIEESIDNLKAQFNILTELNKEKFIFEVQQCSRVLQNCCSTRHLDTVGFLSNVERQLASLWSNSVLTLEPLDSDHANAVAARNISPQRSASQPNPFFMHYTISEDRCGSQESTKSALLAA